MLVRSTNINGYAKSMKKIFAWCVLSLWLSGCGQSGPLYFGPAYADTPGAKPVDISDIPDPS